MSFDGPIELNDSTVTSAIYQRALRECNLPAIREISHRYCFAKGRHGEFLYLKLGATCELIISISQAAPQQSLIILASIFLLLCRVCYRPSNPFHSADQLSSVFPLTNQRQFGQLRFHHHPGVGYLVSDLLIIRVVLHIQIHECDN